MLGAIDYLCYSVCKRFVIGEVFNFSFYWLVGCGCGCGCGFRYKDNLFILSIILIMRFLSVVVLFASFLGSVFSEGACSNSSTPINGCVSFSVSSGTGCAWMCNYCANQLGTDNYYFTDNVCTYQQGVGCVGNPIAGKTYTCCSSS